MNNNLVFSVSELNAYVKSVLDGDQNLKMIFVTGEISNLVMHRSGHFYFTIKDESAAIKSVMFSYSASRLKFPPKNGMQIIALGRVSIYERDGQYQFYAEDIRRSGEGNLYAFYEQLKEKLEKEGLFDNNHKKPVPEYPEKIGIITSPSGAVIKDILNVLSRRYPLTEIVFVGVKVQGSGAALEMVRAIERLNQSNACDVIIIGRGGGSLEDLFEFNNEQLVRAVFHSKIPVISAVGHETDFTLCDFAADLRAPTPSAAAELATPDMHEIADTVSLLYSNIKSLLNRKLTENKNRLGYLTAKEVFLSPLSLIGARKTKLELLCKNLGVNFEKKLKEKDAQLALLSGKIHSLSPLLTLSRGFMIGTVQDTVVKSVDQLKKNEKINLILADGTADCEILDISKRGEKNG